MEMFVPCVSVASETNTEGGHAMQATSSFTSSKRCSGSFTEAGSCALVAVVALRQMLRCPLPGLKRISSSTAAACTPSGSNVQNPYIFCEGRRNLCPQETYWAFMQLAKVVVEVHFDGKSAWGQACKVYTSPDDVSR